MLKAVKQTGCRVIVSSSRVSFSHIPSWCAYRYIRHRLDKLVAIAVTEKIFKSHPEPKRIKFQEKLDKCPHCRHYGRSPCAYKDDQYRIPAGTMEKGCEHWEESTSIYF